MRTKAPVINCGMRNAECGMLGLLLALLCLVCLPLPARAQQPDAPNAANRPLRQAQKLQQQLAKQQQQVHPLQRWLRAQMIALQRLELTPEQQEQLRAIPARHEGEWQELGRRAKQAQNGFQRMLANDADVKPEVIDERARAIGAAEGELARLVAQIWNEARQILTPEQRQRLREIRAEQMRQRQLLNNPNNLSPEAASPENAPRPGAKLRQRLDNLRANPAAARPVPAAPSKQP